MSAKSDGQVVIEIVADDKKAEKTLQSFNKSAEDVGRSAEESAKKIDKTCESLGKAASASEAASEDIEKVGKKSKDSEEEVEGLGKASDETQKQMLALSASCAALCAGLVAIGVQAVHASMEFDSAFAKTKTIMDTNAMSVAQMREEIMALSSLSAMSGATVSEAVYQAISGSVATEDATAFVEKANKLAVSGFTSLSNATDVLTTALNAYGLEAEKVGGISNVLIQTQNLGKTSVDELAASMGKAISTGSAYGVNIENLSTAYVELTRGGIATAEATTYIASMLNELGDSGSTVGTVLQENTGKSFGQLMAQGVSLGDVLKILSDTVDGDAEALMGLWSSQEAGKASNAIMTQGIEDFNAVLKQMDAEMSGTTGTTDKAYETMTHTSEFIDQKFCNSVNNLGVAFGDNLSPAVDWVKSSLTMVTDTLTSWVRDYPAVSAVAVGLTVGVGALGLTLAAYTLKAKLATSQTLKLTAAMMSNPITLIITGVTALGAALVAFASASSEATEEVEKLSAASETQRRELEDLRAEYEAVCKAQGETSAEAQLLKEKLDKQTEAFEKNKKTAQDLADELKKTHDAYVEMTQQYDETVAGIDAEYESTLNLIARLNELTDAERQSASAKQEILTIVDLLNERIPELGLNYDTLTGKLNMTPEDVIQAATVANNTEKTNAEYEALKEHIALRDSGKLEYSRDNALAERERTEKELIAAWETIYSYADVQFSRGRSYLTKKMTEAGFSQYSADEAVIDWLKDTMSDNAYSAGGIYTLDSAINAFNIWENNLYCAVADIKDNQAAIDSLSQSLANYREEAKNFALEFFPTAVAEEWNSAALILSEAYDAAYASARESIEGQIGLFENIEKVTAASVSNMIKSLDSQIAYLDQYSENMRIAAERGIDQGLLQKLNDGSKESAEILAGLVSATDDQIKELNEKFAKVGDGKDAFAEAMTEYSGVIEDEKQVMVDLAAQVGLDMSDSLTQGLLSGYDKYLAAWRSFQNISHNYNLTESINAYAGGTYSADSGLALVGEAGPELMYLRGGERILTAEETREALNAVYPVAPQMAMVGVGAPAIAGRGAIQLRATLHVPLNVDGREFASATAEFMGEEMEFGGM